jgi:uncharacterized membrane protein YqjE
MDDGLGFGFWAGLAGITAACGIALLVLIVIFDWAAYTWGFFGVLVVLAVLLLVVAWVIDRRKVRQYEDEEAELR